MAIDVAQLKSNRQVVVASVKSAPEVQQRTASRISTMVAKLVMAVTGAGLIGFLLVHLVGNLQIFLGPEILNTYAAKLKNLTALLWTARVALIVMFAAHIGSAIYLKRQNRLARPQRYVVDRAQGSTLASRSMFLSGMTIATFLVYHLLHFTIGVTDPRSHALVDAAGRHDVYSMVVLGFGNVFVSAAYITAMVFVGLHLRHAVSSMFQTIGLARDRVRGLLDRAAIALSVVIVVGNVSIPLSVLGGLVSLPEGVMQ